MANFTEAFKKGLEAAQTADRARKEIDKVFKDLNYQLLTETGNKIGINRKEFVEPNVMGGMKLPAIPGRENKYWAIVAFNPSFKNSPVKILARWSMDRAGYPCKISWKNTLYRCEDKEALENILAEILQDPLVGETLYSLMKWEKPQPEKGSE